MSIKNVLFLTGGAYAEHEISIISKNNVMQYVNLQKYNVIVVVIGKDRVWRDEKHNIVCHLIKQNENSCLLFEDGSFILIDVVFPLVLGDAEDGGLQGLCESLDLKYVGNNILSSSLGFDKIIAKKLVNSYGINITPFIDYYLTPVGYDEACSILNNNVLFIKPSNNGSTIGCSKVTNALDFCAGVKLAQQYGKFVLIESFLNVREISCCLFLDYVSNLSEIVYDSKSEFFGYDDKYVIGYEVITPALIPLHIAEKMLKQSCEIFKILRCNALARIDFFLVGDEIYFNEINTMPAMTPKSSYLRILQNCGYSQDVVVNGLIESAL